MPQLSAGSAKVWISDGVFDVGSTRIVQRFQPGFGFRITHWIERRSPGCRLSGFDNCVSGGDIQVNKKTTRSVEYESNMHMKTNTKICTAVLAIGLCVWSTQAFGQATTTTTTATTTNGAFTEYVPGSQTVVVRSQSNPAPLRYVVTKQTTVVDEAGAPLSVERIPAGSPLSVQYTGTGDQLTASRIIVHRAAAVNAPVTTAPVATQESTTTTTVERPLTHHQKHELKEAEEHKRKALEHEEKAAEGDR